MFLPLIIVAALWWLAQIAIYLVGGAAVIWIASAILGSQLGLLAHLFFAGIGFFLAYKYGIPVISRYLKTSSKPSRNNLLILAGVISVFVILGIPGLAFSITDSPVQSIGIQVLPQYPLLGFSLGLLLISALLIKIFKR